MYQMLLEIVYIMTACRLKEVIVFIMFMLWKFYQLHGLWRHSHSTLVMSQDLILRGAKEINGEMKL